MFIWFGGLAWTLTSCAFTKSWVTELLSQTPEYQCLKLDRGRDPYVSWGGRRYLRPRTGGNSTMGGSVFATLKERKNTDCIADGDAVTFVTLPLTSGPERSLIAFPGDEVATEYRGDDRWIDILSLDRSMRYRNDGSGYHRIEE